MANKNFSIDTLTTNQLSTYNFNAELLNYWRANPVQASIDLIGFQPLDYQAYILQRTWVSQYALWCITRNGAKSLIGGLYMKLASMLFEGVKIYIVSSVGNQAKDTFRNIENLSMDNLPTAKGLKDIYLGEVSKSNNSVTGFSHDPSGYKVSLLNGSFIQTMNSIADNNRGKRAEIVFFDECGYMAEEQIVVAEAFTTTETSFTTSVDEFYNPYLNREKRPAQLIYASSASDKTTYFYRKYAEFAKRMWAGDKLYFVVDIDVSVPLAPTLKGKEYPPLLDAGKPEAMMATNPAKAMREYYNKFDEDGGDDQIIKGHTIERNSTFLLPEVFPEKGSKYLIAYDPAAVADNAIVGIMKVCEDKQRGIYGKLVNMVNFKDLADRKGNLQKSYTEQLDEIRKYLVLYNGENNPEYLNIQKLAIDAGSGGGGHLYGHSLMEDWKDKNGIIHRGVVDREYHKDKWRDFPNAYPILNMVEPSKMKPTIVGHLIELMDLGLIEFPKEYGGSGGILIEDENGELVKRPLSKEEELALINIDICKEETKMIHRYKNPNGTLSYNTRTDMRRKIHDDRFYVLALLAGEIMKLREVENLKTKGSKKEKRSRVSKLMGAGTKSMV